MMSLEVKKGEWSVPENQCGINKNSERRPMREKACMQASAANRWPNARKWKSYPPVHCKLVNPDLGHGQ